MPYPLEYLASKMINVLVYGRKDLGNVILGLSDSQVCVSDHDESRTTVIVTVVTQGQGSYKEGRPSPQANHRARVVLDLKRYLVDSPTNFHSTWAQPESWQLGLASSMSFQGPQILKSVPGCNANNSWHCCPSQRLETSATWKSKKKIIWGIQLSGTVWGNITGC